MKQETGGQSVRGVRGKGKWRLARAARWPGAGMLAAGLCWLLTAGLRRLLATTLPIARRRYAADDTAHELARLLRALRTRGQEDLEMNIDLKKTFSDNFYGP